MLRIFRTHSVHLVLAGRAVHLLLLIAMGLLAGRAHAALEADITTSKGVVTVVLEHTKAPRAVANFMTLADGSRRWVDSRNGAVNDGPFYPGLAFHRVENTAGSKLAEFGSKNGSGTDDPGYRFPDELDATLIHEPYVMAYASDAPNGSGSRVYFTGNVSLPARDGRNVVFGKIPSAAGRQVIDAILAAGNGGTTVLSVSIRRTDPVALAFDQAAVPLPVVHPVAGPLHVTPGVSVRLNAPRGVMTTLQAHASTDLAGWAPHFRSFAGLDDAVPVQPETIDAAQLARRFYQFSLVEFPGAGGASDFAGRTLTIITEGTGPIVYDFDATGLAGTYLNTPLPGLPLSFTGHFTVRPEIPAKYDAYGFSVLLFADGLGGAPMNWIRGGYDMIGAGSVTGRQVTGFFDAALNPVFEDSGSLELSRP
jgi:peptidyl-prolyl cis-trans isomerase A (cyclophilin A)